MQSKSERQDDPNELIPIKAVRMKSLKVISKTADPEASKEPSCHTVSFCEFLDADGEKKKGFFKPTSEKEKYPAVLAKFAVASAAFMRLTLGKRAAEDRLVLDDQGQIVGTISLALPGFKPLPEKADYTYLLQHNILELMLICYIFNEDDLHRGNISEVGVIDRDMSLWWLTQWIKGRRGNPGNAPNFEAKNFANMLVTFISTAWSPIHWPGYWIPGNGNIWKQYPNYTEFKKLEDNPALIDPNSGTVITTAQQQIYSAALKFILTYQPEVLRNQLIDLFGDMPFDFESLDAATAADLKKHLPKYCTPETNKQPFVDVLMTIYQDIYDEVYRKLMLYPGGINSKGIDMPSFRDFLLNTPQAYQEIYEVLAERNQEMDTRASQLPASARAYEPDNLDRRFNLQSLEQRYHQFWRNMYYNDVERVLEQSKGLITRLLADQQASIAAISSPVEKSSLTDALTGLQGVMLDDDLDKLRGMLKTDPDGQYYAGTVQLIQFHFKLQGLIKDYFSIAPDGLLSDHNKAFTKGLYELYQESEEVPKLLADPWRGEFTKIWIQVNSLLVNIDFPKHLRAEANTKKVEALVDTHKGQVTRDACIKALFAWLKTQSSEEFEALVHESIREYQKKGSLFGAILGSRSRVPEVQTYLVNSKCLDSDFRFARILMSNGHEDGDFNRYLVRRCIRAMVDKAIPGDVTSFPAVKKALQMDKFDSDSYRDQAVHYAKTQDEYTNLLNTRMLAQLTSALYSWVDDFPREQLQALASSAQKEYGNKWFGSTNRAGLVERVFADKQAKTSILVAKIFGEGGIEPSSLNYKLLVKLMTAFRKDVNSSPEKQANGTYQMLMRLEDKHYSEFLRTLQANASKRIGAGVDTTTALPLSFA